MQTLGHPTFLISALLFCLNRALELNELYLWPLHAYLDDLLCMPLALTLILSAERFYFKNYNFTLPWHYIVWAVVLFAFFFELLLPAFSSRYTADALDVVAYAIGAAVFCFSLNKPLCKVRKFKS